MTLLLKRSFVSRYFALALDGEESPGFLKAVEGGGIKADLVTQQVGGQAITSKHIGKPLVEAFSVQVGMSMTGGFYDWISKSWSGDVERKNGAILTYDRNFKVIHEHSFTDALITETTIPALDAAAKDTAAYMTIKFQAEQSEHNVEPDMQKYRAKEPPKQKVWSPNNFRLDIDGLECKRVSKIESFTIKQNVKPLACGPDRVVQLEPTKLEYPNITFWISMVNAKPFFDWHEDFVVNGNCGPDQEKTGSIAFLDPDRDETLLTINMKGIGISSITNEKGDTGQDAIKRVKVELYVEEFAFEYGGGGEDEAEEEEGEETKLEVPELEIPGVELGAEASVEGAPSASASLEISAEVEVGGGASVEVSAEVSVGGDGGGEGGGAPPSDGGDGGGAG